VSNLIYKKVLFVETYTARADGTDPFTVTISEQENRLTVTYCHGAFSTSWSNQGEPFSKFLKRLDDDYILKNLLLHEGKVFKLDVTQDALIARVIGAVNSKEILKTEGKLLISSIKNASDDDSIHDLIADMQKDHENVLSEIWGEDYIHAIMQDANFDYIGSTRFFINKIWPHVRQIITEAK